MSTDTIPTLITDIAAIDWNDLASVDATSDKLLTALDSDRTTLRELAEHALDNPQLRHLCEHYDILDKIVLRGDRNRRAAAGRSGAQPIGPVDLQAQSAPLQPSGVCW
ncbi:MAG: hypothetical protein ACRDRE_13510 [Pseudonocardiaceae bacterium]